LKRVTLLNVHNINRRQNESMTLTLGANFEGQTSHTWTESTSNTCHVGVPVEWKAETNMIAEKSELTIGSDFSWERGTVSTTEETDSSGTTLVAQLSTDVKPGRAAHCVAFAVEGTQDVKWSGAAGGEYKDVQYTDVYQQCNDEDIADVEAQINSGNGKEVAMPSRAWLCRSRGQELGCRTNQL
jgi:hypothetical protein